MRGGGGSLDHGRLASGGGAGVTEPARPSKAALAAPKVGTERDQLNRRPDRPEADLEPVSHRVDFDVHVRGHGDGIHL